MAAQSPGHSWANLRCWVVVVVVVVVVGFFLFFFFVVVVVVSISTSRRISVGLAGAPPWAACSPDFARGMWA